MLRPRRGMKKQHAYLEKSPSRLLGFYFQASTTNLSPNKKADGIQNQETFSFVASVHFLLLKI